MKFLLSFFVLFSSATTAFAAVELSFNDVYVKSDWQLGGKKRPAKGVAKKIYDLQDLKQRRQYISCVSLAGQIAIESEALAPWARTQKLFCLWNGFRKKKFKESELRSELEVLESGYLKADDFGSYIKMQEYARGVRKTLKISEAEVKLKPKLTRDFKDVKYLYNKKKHKEFLKKSVKLMLDDKATESSKKWTRARLSWLGYKVARKKTKGLVWKAYLSALGKLKEGDLIYLCRYLRGKAKYIEASDLALSAQGLFNSSAESHFEGGFSLMLAGDTDGAKVHLEQAVQKSKKGSELRSESYFRLGLIYLRGNDNKKAIQFFDEALSENKDSNFNMRLMYWRVVVLKELKSKRLKELKEAFIKRYPMTYYSLKLQATDASFKWPQKKWTQFKTKMNWSKKNELNFNAFKFFLEAGLLKESERALKTLPEGKSVLQNIILAHLWKQTGNHYYAVKYVSLAWDQDSSTMTRPFLTLAFPVEHQKQIKLRARKNKLHSALIAGLIKQESSYNALAVSGSNARGLMQLIPSTAREMSRRLKRRPLRNRDLFRPDINIRLGSYYLKTRLRSFGGNLALALASYNVGIGNIQKWMSARSEILNLKAMSDADPRAEIWIDELPWEETSFYVKAVLRNYIMYRLIEEGSIKLPPVTWAGAVL